MDMNVKLSALHLVSLNTARVFLMLAIETTEVTTASNFGLVFNHEQWLEVQYHISKCTDFERKLAKSGTAATRRIETTATPTPDHPLTPQPLFICLTD
jgi:hypothetical protein